MTVARVMFLARYRVPHAVMALQFDHLIQGTDVTVIATPLDQAELWPIFQRYNIDTSRFVYVNDQVIYDQYPEVNHWMFEGDYRGPWLRQQAIKLAYLDLLDYDVVLLTDPDTIMTEPYCCWHNGRLRMLALQNTTHGSYDRVLPAVLGIERQTTHCFVTELVPVVRADWIALRTQLNQLYPDQTWLDAIIDHVPGMPTVPPWGTGNAIKWFSEYEFLGNWTLTQRQVDWQWQRRFEYSDLSQLKDFQKEFNCFADAVPDLRNSLQLNWETGEITDWNLHFDIISGHLK